MFQFPWFPLPALCVQTGVTPHDGCRVSPFGHPRINARSTASRGFSQSPTSFIGSRRQGIHRSLFVAWMNNVFPSSAGVHHESYVALKDKDLAETARGQPPRELGLALQFSRGDEKSTGAAETFAYDADGGSLKTEERTQDPGSSRPQEN